MADKPTPVTDAERARILELHKAGWTRNKITEETGRSFGTVSKVVKDTGGSFTRVGEAGRAARHADLANRRARIIDSAHTELQATLQRITDAPRLGYDALVKGEGGVEVTERLLYVPARDLQQLTNSARALAGTIETLGKVGQGDGLDAAHSMLGSLMAALNAARPE